MLAAILGTLGLVHGGGLNHRRELGLGIPTMGGRFFCRHHKSFRTIVLFPSIQRGLGNTCFTTYLGDTLVIGWHHFLDDLFFEFGAVGRHQTTPSAPGFCKKEKLNDRTTSVTEGGYE